MHWRAVCLHTAAKTEMTLTASVRSFTSLQDRCRAVIARHLVIPSRTAVDTLPLPLSLKQYVSDVVDVGCNSSRLLSTQTQYPPLRRRVNVALKFWPPSDANYWPKAGWVGDCAVQK